MRTEIDTVPAVQADYGLAGILIHNHNIHGAGLGATPTAQAAFFSVMNASSRTLRKSPGRAGLDTWGRDTGQAITGFESCSKAAQGADLDTGTD